MTTAFDLGAMLGGGQPQIHEISCNCLLPYHNHKFTLYTGERLEDMVESIRENGVLSPIIVQPLHDGLYEILIGHNRWNAAKLAGRSTVPALVKEGLSEAEAEMYVIESNLMQRGFDHLAISEQAAVIAQRHSEMFSQGKRNDIIRELEILEHTGGEIEAVTSCPVGEKLDTGQTIAENYGLSKRTVARLIRIDKLTDSLKAFIDAGMLSVRSGVELSFLSEDTQNLLAELIPDHKIDMKKASQLRENADENGNLTAAQILQILSDSGSEKPKSVKISEDSYRKYFPAGTKSKEVTETIEKALAFYFSEDKNKRNFSPTGHKVPREGEE